MNITEILNVFPSEELNLDGDETKRDFWVPNVSTSAHFFLFPQNSNGIVCL